MKKSSIVRIGSRESELALWQSNWVGQHLQGRFPGLQIEIVVIKTTGDRITDVPLSKIGDKGTFIKELEHALLDGRIDLAVHSLKDVPTSLPEGLTLGAITRREDVRDVFVAHPGKPYRRIDEIPLAARIATGSLRRKCQLLHWRHDLEIIDIRGNLTTRFKKLEHSDWDGMILARAGVVRLGVEDRITETLPLDRMLPAVGQGALAVEIREGNGNIKKRVSTIHDEETATAVSSERSLLRHLEGGCQVPIGAYGKVEGDELTLVALVGSVDGRKVVRGKIHGRPEESEDLGRMLARTLLAGGAHDILERIRATGIPSVPVV